MGARAHMFPRLMQIMPHEMHFGFIGRPERASPGEGYPAAHIDRTEPHRHDGDRPAPADLPVPAKDPGAALMWALWKRLLQIRRQRKRKKRGCGR